MGWPELRDGEGQACVFKNCSMRLDEGAHRTFHLVQKGKGNQLAKVSQLIAGNPESRTHLSRFTN